MTSGSLSTCNMYHVFNPGGIKRLQKYIDSLCVLEGVDGILVLLPGLRVPVHLAQAAGVTAVKLVQQLFRVAAFLG